MPKTGGKASKQLKNKSEFLVDPRPNDLVIAVIGRTGVGKSTFVNILLGEEVAVVGRSLKSATSKVQHHVYSHPQHAERRILIVDTPGFDDRDLSEKEVLKRIAVWLAKSYRAKAELAGLVYMFDINTTRFGAAETKSSEIFEALCGKDGASRVILATSKWDKLQDVKEGEDREKELEKEFWHDMFQSGSTMHRLQRSEESAQESAQTSAQKIIDSILLSGFTGCATIQKEMVNQKKRLSETAAGRIAVGGKAETGWMGFLISRFKRLFIVMKKI